MRYLKLIAVAWLAILAVAFLVMERFVDAPQVEGPWIYGSSHARFTLTEYADLECPYCREYFPLLKSWIDRNPEANLKWHHLPLSIHEPAASKNAQLVECIGARNGNNDFWKTVELVYQQTRGNGAGLAGKLNVSRPDEQRLLGAVEQCMTFNEQAAERVREQAQQAAVLGINTTPTIVITDNKTGRSVKLSGQADDNALLSAVDWLASQ
ncbi:thioredoxin domain-containing protein [Pseudomonas sp. KFB-139]|uniref:Thioredoxin domain-containing protein n=1 Tax=Pseudomonas serbiensis TaxID=3064350 RepID=A0ABT9CSR2_9PSED|nr:thioredoxin domain-containing protein [Pseudomonas sp. KFB-138]MDO7927752.1 thioredoxin domain-containing protein [Pseudomonas sp. KFB-138]